jgi:predicted lactoylglutathione lyase
VQVPIDGSPAADSNGAHFCFIASSKEAVDAFYSAALEAGATGDGEPGLRPDYGADRDLDGHKIEAAIIPQE